MSKVRPEDHPDFIGGWKWSKLELDWINERIGTLEAAAQRQWVGLTDEERKQIRSRIQVYLGMTQYEYGLAVQQATELVLKEKNHG